MSPKNLRKLNTEKIPFERIEETKLPLYIISTDIKCGEEVVFDKGLLIEALMASVGIPGVFPPQHMEDRAMVDGALVNNTPISTAVKLGAECVVIFPIGVPSADQDPKNVMEILIRSFIYLLNRQLATDIQIYKNKVELVIVPPPECIDVRPHDFSKSNYLINEAYKKAKDWLRTDGFKPNSEKYSHPCDVHSSAINFLEAVVPEGLKAKERIKVNISETSKALKDSLYDKSDEIKAGIISKRDELKEKVTRKKIDEKSEE
ncbi:MAG: patatin-like phospholipase family protein [Candidatus Heimdallarchaeota archaeon]